MDDTDLRRFLVAQDLAYDTATTELTAGRKESHWMWFIFPQLRGLGTSERARFYGIADLSEATAYLAHPVLSPRLAECFGLVLTHSERDIEEIFGATDTAKYRSSATLFAQVPGAPGVFRRALEAFELTPDPRTLERL